jgi:amidohydrolase
MKKGLLSRFVFFQKNILEKENVAETGIWMAAEDFASYSQAADACFYLLGIGNKQKGIVSSLHPLLHSILTRDALP